jgi:hypothetical protein
MNYLLEKDFISHYKLAVRTSVNVVSTRDPGFDIVDDLKLVYPPGSGIAKYNNPARKEANVINYELFINSLTPAFQKGREKCDLIVYTADFSYFILNELTDTQPQYIPDFTSTDGTPRTGKRNKAISQLKNTLNDISDVPTINRFIKKHTVKHCCFFNKQANAPSGITATIAFGRLSALSPHGFKMVNVDIESYGFELWEFSGSQAYLLEDE